MKCTACGHENTDDARFCGICGAPLTPAAEGAATAPETGTDGAPSQAAPAAVPSPDAAPAAASAQPSPSDATTVNPALAAASAPNPNIASPAAVNPAAEYATHAKSQRDPRTAIKVIAAILIACSLAAIAGMAYLDWQREATRDVQLAKTFPIGLTINAEGLNSTTGTKVPVKAVGTTAAGDSFDQTFYARQGDKSGIELAQGTYTLTIPASPIASDGTLYDVSGVTVQLTVGEQGLAEAPTVTLPVIDAINVTDEQIAAAYQAAKDGGANNADDAEALKDAATKRRDDAVAKKREEEAAQQAAAEKAKKRHVTAASYEFDIPEYWLDRVIVKVSGDQVDIYSKTYPTREIVSVNVVQTETMTAGDPSGSQIGTPITLDGTRSIQVWAKHWGIITQEQVKMGEQGITVDDPLTMAEVDELVLLQTGGQVRYSDDPSQFSMENLSSAAAQADQTYLNQNINGTIKAK